MTDFFHISLNNESITFGIALDHKPCKATKNKLEDLFSKPKAKKLNSFLKVRKFAIGSVVFYYIKERSLIESYVEQLKCPTTKISDSISAIIKNQKPAVIRKEQEGIQRDAIAEELLRALEKAKDEADSTDPLKQWLSKAKETVPPSPDFIQKAYRWNKIVEEKNKLFGSAKLVPFEL